MKSVNKLLNKERQAKEAIVEAQNVLANIGQEKVDLGFQILAEAKEKLDVLEVGYLLNTNIAERVMAPVRITRLDGRVLKLRARKQDAERIALLETQRKEQQQTINDLVKEVKELKAKQSDNGDKAKLESDIKGLQKVISELTAQIATESVEADTKIAELQEKLDAAKKTEEEYKAAIKTYNTNVADLEKKIAELEAKNSDLTAKVSELESKATVNTNVYDEYAEYNEYLNSQEYYEMLESQEQEYLASQEEENKDIKKTVEDVLENRKGNGERVGSPKERLINEFNNISDEEIEESIVEIKTEETVKEETVEVVAPEFAKVVKTKVNFKGGNAKLFKTDNCYLIASPSAREITWLSKEELTDEYKQSVVNTLVRDYKFHEHRTQLSPIIIDDEKIYMARTYAKAGVGTFCNDDIIAGHVKIGGSKDFILYTYFPNTNKAIIESLEKKLLMAEGKLKAGNTMPDNKALLGKVNAAIRGTYKKYKAQTDAVLKQQQDDAKKADETFNASQDELDKILAAQNAIIAAAAKNDPNLAAAYNQNNNINNGGDNKGDSNAEKVVVEPIFRLSPSLTATAEEYDI
ncbi:MAG: hypothetical protein J6D47_15370 [Peptostreptococcaceae bacterium]|nr:hypothetical protein [Peptostreptococcaceae bacterium]